MPKKIKYLIVALCVGVVLFVVNAHQSNPGQVLGTYVATSTPESMRLIFFDVGQGDSSFVIAPDGEDILIDGGPDNKVVQKLGEYLPFSDRKIEYVILTHPHSDHIDGLVETLKRYNVGRVIMTGVSYSTADYQEFLQLIKDKSIPVTIIDRPQTLAIGSVGLEFLEPDKSLAGKQIDNLNNSSIVFKLVFASTSALFMGDYENEEILASSTAVAGIDILKVGHHGSTNANSKGFVNSASPEFAVISVGQGNKYGHPHYRTLYYLSQAGARIFRTDLSGDVIFTSDGQTMQALTNSE